jgi:hypothetical protein
VALVGFNGQGGAQVYVKLVPGPLTALYGTDPIPIDGNTATWSGVGLLVDVPSSTPDTVGPTRHWVNASAILELTQQQPNPTPSN